jgi:hypothetical protein
MKLQFDKTYVLILISRALKKCKKWLLKILNRICIFIFKIKVMVTFLKHGATKKNIKKVLDGISGGREMA